MISQNQIWGECTTALTESGCNITIVSHLKSATHQPKQKGIKRLAKRNVVDLKEK